MPLKPHSAQEDGYFRRVRPTLRGTLGEHTTFKLMSDLSDGRHELQDAYLTYRFSEALQLTAGKTKLPVGMEVLQSSSDMRFIERSPVSSLLPGREWGLMTEGKSEGWEYALGLFTSGAADEWPDSDDRQNPILAGHLLYTPFSGLQFGIGADFGQQDGNAGRKRLNSAESSAGGEPVDYLASARAGGTVWSISPQLQYYRGSLGMMAEYAYLSQETANATTGAHDRLSFHAAQISAGYMLTGEAAKSDNFVPESPWGAWELTGRLASVDASGANDPRFVDSTASADRMAAATAGLNWHMNSHVKIMVNYEYAVFSENLPEEQSIFTRLQLKY